MISLRPCLIILLAMPCVFAAHSACAREVSGDFGIASDYRFRGLSLSDRSPVIQGGVALEEHGWQAEVWGSIRADGRAEGREVDLYLGRTGSIGSFGYKAGARIYMVDGAATYVEATAQLNRSLGVLRVDAELSYAPAQSGQRDNLYAAVAVSVSPVEAVLLSARAGVEDSAVYGFKRDWEARVALSSGDVTISGAIVQAHGNGVTLEERAAAGVFSIQVEL